MDEIEWRLDENFPYYCLPPSHDSWDDNVSDDDLQEILNFNADLGNIIFEKYIENC